MYKFRLAVLLFIFSISLCLEAQVIQLSGTIFSYTAKKTKFFKSSKNLNFEGPLGGVNIYISGASGATNFTTNMDGNYSITIREAGTYQVKISKEGYTTLNYELNYESQGTKAYFPSLLFILKQDDKQSIQLGTLSIKDGNLNFDPKKLENSSAEDIYNSNLGLMDKDIYIINMSENTGPKKTVEKPVKEKIVYVNGKKDTSQTTEVKPTENPSMKIAVPSLLLSENMDSLKLDLQQTKERIKTLDPNSDEYKGLQMEIDLAEKKIKDKEALIELQQKELSSSGKIITYLSLFLIVLALSLGLAFYSFRIKKQYAAVLLANNEKITKINNRLLSSIRYASVIQESFLPPPNDLKKLFSNSFIFNRPKDILSGDFHWFAEKNDHKILIVADCTGHGVPGAMLTVLANRILDEVIQVNGITRPSKILMALNTSIVETFNAVKEHLDFGMDISVISYHTKKEELLFSGIGNGIYKVCNGESSYYSGTAKYLGADLLESDVADQAIAFKKGDSFYLFSDGYADQFSGNEKETIKFNVKRFEELIKEVANGEMNKGAERFEKTLINWMGDAPQVDDICIMGFSV